MIRTLPLRVAPATGEALDSWLETIATRCDAPLGAVVRAVGIEGGPTVFWRRVVELTERECQDVAYATGIDTAAVAATTLAHYDGTALAINHRRHQLKHAFPFGCRSWSRYCPACLRETDGRWQLHWRLGWTFACIRHRCLLADRCPRCDRPQRKKFPHYTEVPQPSRCGGNLKAPCGADLASARIMQLAAAHPLIEAQKQIYEIIADNRAAFGLYAAQPCPARVALTDIKALACRILAYAADNGLAAIEPVCVLPHDADPPPVSWRYRHNTAEMNAPQAALDAGVAITAALTVLRADDVAAAAEKVRWLVAGRVKRGSGQALAAYARDERLISSVLLKVFAPTAGSALTGAHMQLRYRTTLAVPAPPTSAHARLHRRARRTPSILWPDWSLRLQTRESHYWHLRCALSTATLLVGTTASVADATSILGTVIDANSATKAIQQLQHSPHWKGVCTAVTRLSQYLDDTPTPINYERRRRLNYATLLTPDRWVQICRQTGALPGKSRGQKALVARAHLYQKISGRPATDILQGTPPALREDLVQRVANFPRRVTPHVARLLAEESRRFLRANHIHEPPTWSPPLELVADLDLPGPDPALIKIEQLHDIAADMTVPIGAIARHFNVSTHTVRFLLDEYPTEPRASSAVERARTQLCPAITAETLEQLYVQQGLNLNQIAAQFGTTRFTVARLLHRDGVVIRHRPPPPDGDWLYEQHIIKRRTLADIADEAGVQPRAVHAWKKRHLGAAESDVAADRPRSPSGRFDRSVLQPWFAQDTPSPWLTHYVETLRHPTMQAAAQHLGIKPATLRYRIRALERIFGAPLLLRARHGLALRPTALGEEVAHAITELIGLNTVEAGQPST
ncbi:LysR family transcriptional regulator [Mycolicibacterium sp. 018/SC-01/001]|uniref:TniQ family protein n=1 Tax=Mycolicibacterium sp. 018/SC-01/001 TaxID=2592069 RepID=UPI00117F67E6|nr:TniQ family protein [Mycolicibacterium sp. 018/SC-01/001]TRW80995.1 LysR family transcriptional regulator [Mycolicibacterium sp. 018/SC-01/001]